VEFDLLHPRNQIVAIMDRVYNRGMTTLSGGNLSVKDAAGDIWITPAGIDKGNLTPSDISCVRTDGSVSGPHRPSSEVAFHRAIYRECPDLNGIVHAHPPALVSFSSARQIPDTSIIPQARRVCGPVGYAPYALPGSEQLGENLARTFAEGFDVVLLENHGAATGGRDLLEAFQRMETLDFCARTLIQAQGLGPVSTLNEEELALLDRQQSFLPEFEPARRSSRELELRCRIVEAVHRACDRYLMISTEGVVSASVGERSFLITPTGMDRCGLEIEDLVLIEEGRREAGKLPSRSVHMHIAIYDRHPGINAVITAQSPHITAYAVTGGHFDTRTIPESYILLRDVPMVPYGAQFQDPDAVAEALSPEAPVLLIQNDAVLTIGSSVLKAFDRLEVAEYSARSLIDTAAIGDLVPIGEEEIAALRAEVLAS
jgi:L-fuculose-phosphate aldolase